MCDDVIALFEFEVIETDMTIRDEKHYRLVAPNQLTPEELAQYQCAATSSKMTVIIGPYHHARLNAAADRLSVTDFEWSVKGYDTNQP
jgi:hypothetical protein